MSRLRKTGIVVTVMLFAVVALFSAVKPVHAATIADCERKVTLLNYRSTLLTTYKKSEDNKYNSTRKLWSERISYAAQWVPKDAKKTRDTLYAYDDLHRATNKEINKQIKTYLPIESDPLDCKVTSPALLTKKLNEVTGLQGKKIVGGNALIGKYKDAEAKFQKNDFKKSTEGLVKKLHKTKAKHPAPTATKLQVTAAPAS